MNIFLLYVKFQKHSYKLLITLWLCFISGSISYANTFKWIESEGIVALSKNDKIIWQHNHGSTLSKPYIHPLCTPSGYLLTNDKPDDHPWHHGLWWSWKLINGVNFWEEDRATAQSEGKTIVHNIKIDKLPDFSANIIMDIGYRLSEKEEDVLLERREINISPISAKDYTIKWNSVFTAIRLTLLDRTPLPNEVGGKPWGGYAGFSYRASATMKAPAYSITKKELQSEATIQGTEASVTIQCLTDTNNPTPWYVYADMPFISPAILMPKPIVLKAGDKLTTSYIVIIKNP